MFIAQVLHLFLFVTAFVLFNSNALSVAILALSS